MHRNQTWCDVISTSCLTIEETSVRLESKITARKKQHIYIYGGWQRRRKKNSTQKHNEKKKRIRREVFVFTYGCYFQNKRKGEEEKNMGWGNGTLKWARDKGNVEEEREFLVLLCWGLLSTVAIGGRCCSAYWGVCTPKPTWRVTMMSSFKEDPSTIGLLALLSFLGGLVLFLVLFEYSSLFFRLFSFVARSFFSNKFRQKKEQTVTGNELNYLMKKCYWAERYSRDQEPLWWKTALIHYRLFIVGWVGLETRKPFDEE